MKNILNAFMSLLFLVMAGFATEAQQLIKSEYFNLSSAKDIWGNDYGLVKVLAVDKTILINTVIAYGENVKSLNIKINDGFSYKLAPAQNGQSLNYFGSSMNIVLQPGDKALIDFTPASKGSSLRHVFISGQKIN